jgi:hypothetical protein
MGGKKPFTLADEEAWIRARVAEKPDLTGRELLAELNHRGIDVSYYGVWHFLDHVGLSFKKKPPRQRTGSSRRRAAAAAMAAAPEQGRRRAVDFHRRNLGEDQHDAAAWSLRQR